MDVPNKLRDRSGEPRRCTGQIEIHKPSAALTGIHLRVAYQDTTFKAKVMRANRQTGHISCLGFLRKLQSDSALHFRSAFAFYVNLSAPRRPLYVTA